jgi:plasmid replication initiation protein
MSQEQIKTLDIAPRDGEVIIPKELIGLEEMAGWTLFEMRVFDALLTNAWDKGLEKNNAEFTIRLSELRGLHDSNDRIRPALETLQRSLIRAKLPNGKHRTVQYLGATDMDDEDREHGVLTYDFHRKLIPLIRKADIYARMEDKVLSAFTSKFSYALYREVALRVGLRKKSQPLSIPELRGWLGIETGKLTTWNNLNQSALKIALKEVNALSPYKIDIEPVKDRRRVTGVVATWSKKKPFSRDEQTAAHEVNRHRTGRKARISGQTELVHVTELTQQAIEKAANAARVNGGAIFGHGSGGTVRSRAA